MFDDLHGQDRWKDTGFSSREAHTKFLGLAQMIVSLGATWKTANGQAINEALSGISLLIVPPPTGTYDEKHERWCRHSSGLFQPDEIATILRFLQQGGSLLLFAYRFGDSFTQTNLCHLTGPLGCLVNDDAVIDLERIRKENVLQSQFIIPRESIMDTWASQVQTISCRAMATFTILPGAAVQPLVFSPGGRCITFNRTLRQISFQSLPIAVSGTYGKGRFVLFGGPHAFETGIFGLLSEADNVTLLQNILRWLLLETPPTSKKSRSRSRCAAEEKNLTKTIDENWREFCRVEGRGDGEQLVNFVERLLRQSGILKALNCASWSV